MALFLLENRDFLGFRMIFKVRLNQIFSNINTMRCTIKYRLSSIDIHRSWIMALFLLENRAFKKVSEWKFGMQGYLWSPDQLSLVFSSKWAKIWSDDDTTIYKKNNPVHKPDPTTGSYPRLD
jgi:hypothetical protein